MYDWLAVATSDASEVITASRRLARVLKEVHAEQQFVAGQTAWATPVISEWQDWTMNLVLTNANQRSMPIVISSQQSRILWERCLRREINDPLLNIGVLAKQSRDTWNRLREWRVSLAECQRLARNNDQRLFAVACNSYESILKREGWMDEIGVAAQAIALLQSGKLATPDVLTLAGFDRVSPLLQGILDSYTAAGGSVQSATVEQVNATLTGRQLTKLENTDAELRAAGAWARQELMKSPQARIGIVVTQLEHDAQRSLRLIKEGLIPGWQNAGRKPDRVINISYGKKLSDYPVIANALLALDWLRGDLSSIEISSLLRASVFGDANDDNRIRIELILRDLPEQSWSAAGFIRYFRRHQEADDNSSDGLEFINAIAQQQMQLPKRQSPGQWVSLFSDLLQDMGWPGAESLSSAEFQTINRWRELLNEVARLELVLDSATAGEVLGRIATIASETLFQPEGDAAAVNVMGPLEAAGLEFEQLWVTGACGSNWPPQGRSSSLISRELQREHRMPDATPADTLEYANRVLRRLAASSSQVTFSYPGALNDAPQSASELLHDIVSSDERHGTDPGWNATHLLDRVSIVQATTDPVPSLQPGESVAGGAAIIQRQFEEPFAAFVIGRLGIRVLWPLQAGLPPNLRGSLIHNALQSLYSDCPSSADIRSWEDAQIREVTSTAVETAFQPYARYADDTLLQLLRLEKNRVKHLLRKVINEDANRSDFKIAAVEQDIEASISGLPLRLRIDRIDLGDSQQRVIIDYKTGAPKRLLDRDQNPKDMQLVVYACALENNVGGIGLFNIDSRDVALDAAGRDLSEKLDWDSALASWSEQVERAARQIFDGDVRINSLQTVQQSRPLSLLSRKRELANE